MASQRGICVAAIVAIVLSLGFDLASAADWPMLGRDATRNSVSPERGGPTDFHPGKLDRKTGQWQGGRNIRWRAPLGSQTFGDPVVADGQIWIGTNNHILGAKDPPDASVLAGFATADGKPLYRYISPRLKSGYMHDWPHSAMAGSPLIEGDRMWFVTNRCEVVCLDARPLKNGQDSPATVWKLDMMKDFGVSPCGSRMTLCHFPSIAAHQDWLYVITGNGVDESWIKIPSPDAPSLVCLEKQTGRVVWKDNSPGTNIISGQWASPIVIEAGGKAQVVVPQGDGWVRSFEPGSGKLIWEFDINPKTALFKLGGRSERLTFFAPPVFYEGRLYIASGDHAEHGEGPARLVCIDPTKTGDISSELAQDAEGRLLPRRRVQAVITAKGEKAVPNPNLGLVWEYTKLDRNNNGKLEFEEEFHRSQSSVVIKAGLLVACDFSGIVHCLDAKTGKLHWTYDLLAMIYAQPLIVEDKIYVADEDGDLAIFELSATPPQQPFFEINFDRAIFTAPIFADGVLYVATRNWLFAIAKPAAEQAPKTTGYWPQWRGPERDNRSLDQGLLQEWPPEGPPLAWRVDGLGSDVASVSVADGRVFTFGYHAESEYLVALRESDGELLWKRRLGPAQPRTALMRWLSQRSPTLDGDRLYATTYDGICVCLSTADGSEHWRVSYPEQFAARRPVFGYTDRPLIDGQKLIVVPGGEKASLAALDKMSGKVLWQTLVPNAGLSGYAATVLSTTLPGPRQYLAFMQKGLISVSADGKFLWRYDGNVSETANSHSPLVRGSLVYQANGYGQNLAALRIEYDGKANTSSVHELYSVRQLGFDAFEDASVLWEDRLFCSSSDACICVDVKAGQRLWAKRVTGRGKSALTYADDRLYTLHADGRAALVEPSGVEYIEKGSFLLPDQKPSIGATFPVVTGGRLYLRTDDILFSYNVRQGEKLGPPRSVKLPPLGDAPPADPTRTPRAVFVPTPRDVVEKMLDLAAVAKGETVVDLGSGDGRIVIAAAKRGCKGVGYELDRDLVETSREEAQKQGLADLARFEQKDLFTADLSEVNVVLLYLLPKQLETLLPQFKKLKPGSRIVCHQLPLPGIDPDKKLAVDSANGERHTIYLWTLPLKEQQAK